MLPQSTLILGGAASGKSAYGERFCERAGGACTYIATAQARDGEMSAKITAHQARRGPQWTSLETPIELAEILAKIPTGGVVLIDCATMWLSNQMEAGAGSPAITLLITAISACAAPVVVVSNELGQGIVPENAMARAFRQAHGEMNQQLAAHSALVVTVIAGLPLVLKGALPKEMM